MPDGTVEDYILILKLLKRYNNYKRKSNKIGMFNHSKKLNSCIITDITLIVISDD